VIHPDVTLRRVNDDVGYGVIATADIPRGTVTWVLDAMDRVFEPEEVRAFDVEYRVLLERYTWMDRTGRRILCWDFARFVNHGCEPNTAAAGAFEFDVAIRDIEAGEEITCDYAALNLEEPFVCACPSPRCRHTIRPDDFETSAGVLDPLVRQALPRVVGVAQPLAKWIANWERVRTVTNDPSLAGSILAHRFTDALDELRRGREVVAHPRGSRR
jgi:hypothetical protein